MAFSGSVAAAFSSLPFLHDLQRRESPQRVRMPEAVPRVAPTKAAVEKIILEHQASESAEENEKRDWGWPGGKSVL